MTGTSARENLVDVREYVELLVKQREERGAEDSLEIVDVGAGQGTYADALWGIEGIRLLAVESWMPSAERLRSDYRYAGVITSDIRSRPCLNMLQNFTEDFVVVFGDVLEHMTIHEAHVVWDAAWRSGAHVIVSVPNSPYPQGAIDGNHLEEHIILDPIPELIEHLPQPQWRYDYPVTSTFIWKKDS